MRSSFITLIFLLFLSGCLEEKTQNKQEETGQVTKQQALQNNQEPADEDTVIPKEENIQDASSSIAPDNGNSQLDEAKMLSPTPKQAEEKPVINIVKVTFKIDDNDMVLGNKNSPVVLVEYFSPTCPHCAYYHSTVFPEIKKKYIDTNKIAYVFREFIATKQDLDAAILARCKGDINSFIQFHEIMLKQQDKWAYTNKYRELLTDIGQLGGVSPEEYKQCLNNDKITQILITNTNFVAKAPKFIGTPSFFVNGIQTDNYSIGNISAAIDKAIEEAKNEMDL